MLMSLQIHLIYMSLTHTWHDCCNNQTNDSSTFRPYEHKTVLPDCVTLISRRVNWHRHLLKDVATNVTKLQSRTKKDQVIIRPRLHRTDPVRYILLPDCPLAPSRPTVVPLIIVLPSHSFTPLCYCKQSKKREWAVTNHQHPQHEVTEWNMFACKLRTNLF
jgi:hypothetical protein